MSDKTTPTPWTWAPNEGGIITADGELLLLTGIRTPMTAGKRQDEARANAELIVRAVNSHDAILEALQRIITLGDPGRDKTFDQCSAALYDAYCTARAAIAAVAGEQS